SREAAPSSPDPPRVAPVPSPAPPEVAAPAKPPPPPPKVTLADLRLPLPGAWKAEYNKFLGWEAKKPSPTGRADAEVVRLNECPEDARTPADYAAHLQEKHFLNVDLPGWVEVGDKGELPDGFFFRGVVKKYATKTPPVLGLLAVREVGGLRLRCFSA